MGKNKYKYNIMIDMNDMKLFTDRKLTRKERKDLENRLGIKFELSFFKSQNNNINSILNSDFNSVYRGDKQHGKKEKK